VLPKTERGHPSISILIGEREIKPWGTTGAGARRYAAMNVLTRASTEEEGDEDSRRSRPTFETWSRSPST
jgi:hypothetical protein